MNKCIKCGSYAFNLYKDGIDQGGFCDVHYWQGRAHRAEASEQPVIAWAVMKDGECLSVRRFEPVASGEAEGVEFVPLVRFAEQPAQQEPVADRENAIIRFALHQFMSNAYSHMNAAAQDKDNRHYTVGAVEKFAKDAKDAEALLSRLQFKAPQPAPATELREQEPVCLWQREDDDHMPDTWRSDCGVLWTFTDGGPTDNDMKHCCGCGAKLQEQNT